MTHQPVVTAVAYRRVRMAILPTLIAVLAIGTVTGRASAQATPAPTLTRTVVVAGGGDDVSGGGCVAATQVQVELDGAVLVTTQSTATGAYSAHLIVPVKAVSGNHTVTVLCAGPNGPVVARASVSVGGVATTGSSPFPLLAVASVLLAIGAACLIAATRRKPHGATAA